MLRVAALCGQSRTNLVSQEPIYMREDSRTGLQVHQNLYLSHPDGAAAVREALILAVGGRWQHATEREAEARDNALLDEDCIFFERSDLPKMTGASLWMFEESDGYKVSNIVPADFGQLDIAQYNAVLNDFIDEVVKPAATRSGVEYRVTSAAASISDWMDGETAAALQRFSDGANKSTGRGHPSDERRWIAFLISAHKKGAALDDSQLHRWLVEAEGWSHDTAMELISDYNIARALLQQYDLDAD